MICIALFTLCLVGLIQAHGGKYGNGALDRLKLKNFKDFQDDRSASTSTSSSDSSSDNSRIAKAVEAALREAELAHKYGGKYGQNYYPVAKTFDTFRLRLSTINMANTCALFDCANVVDSTVASDLDGAVVSAVTSAGTFTAEFAGGVATNENDMFTFTVTYAPQAAGEDQFTLTTNVGEFGVNVTSISIATQPQGKSTAPVFFTTAINDGFWDVQTLLNADETLSVQNGTTKIGCNQTFDCIEKEGTTQFTVGLGPASDKQFLVANITGNTTTTFSAGVQKLNNAEFFGQIGLQNLPCANRGAVVYDGVVIATKRQGGATGDSLAHPCLYDELAVVSAADNVGFTNFINELQQVAGRKQLRLRDVVLDAGSFSVLSHKSKFTPCFRVFPDADFEIETFSAMRGGTGVVRSILKNTGAPSDLVQNDAIVFDADNKPTIQVDELAFANLVNDPNAGSRPFTVLPSDVTVTIEKCPEFSYFE